MHAADVAEFVAEGADDLRTQVARHPELAVVDIQLEETALYIEFLKRERPVAGVALPTSLLAPQGQQILRNYEVPILGAPTTDRRLVLYMDCTDFDGQPPSAELLLPDRTPLPPGEWPAMGQGGIILGHRDYGRPVFCRRGLREYHSHVQHEDDPWDRHREGMTLTDIALDVLGQLAHRWTGKREAS